MFAAAAVAAAAALTAISTTQTCDPNQINEATKNGRAQSAEVPVKLTWPQYASQRRNSLQRRKIEITKRLQKTKNNSNNLNNTAIQKSKNNIKKEIEQLKLTAARPTGAQFKVESKGYDLTKPTPPLVHEIPPLLTSLVTNQSEKEKIEEEAWFQELSAKVCNEFIKLNDINNEIKTNEIDSTMNAALSNPTYKNFDLMAEDMLNPNLVKESSDFFATTDQSEISKLLIDYIQSHGHELRKEKNLLGQIVQSIDGEKIKIPRPITAKQQKIIKSYEEKVHYRWDPKWLRVCRKHVCIPVAIVMLFLLLFTNMSSNWIHVNDNQRAGLWFYCNKTTHKLETSTIASILLTTSTSTRPLYNSNEFNHNNQHINNTFSQKIEKPIILHEKSIITENCYATFFFKDNHLAILFLALVGLIFHFIGFVLLIIGLFFSTSNRTLYYFHSAGECLVTSSLINGLDLLVFGAVVSSLAKSELNKSFEFGYCFYLNIIIILFTFFFSSIFYLDDIVNEYSVWKINTDERMRRKAAMNVRRKPPQR